MVFNTLYNVVDVYFAGWIGADAQAGLTIAGTVLFVLLALGFGIGSGVNALIGTALGEEDRPQAAVLAGQALAFTVLVGVPATALGYVAAPYMLDLLGATGAYREAARTMILQLWGDRIESVEDDARDPKTALQEWAQARQLPPPVYSQQARSGPDHAPVFAMRAELSDGRSAAASAGSKRQAEQAAARALRDALEGQTGDE